jgi:hypothetical protein
VPTGRWKRVVPAKAVAGVTRRISEILTLAETMVQLDDPDHLGLGRGRWWWWWHFDCELVGVCGVWVLCKIVWCIVEGCLVEYVADDGVVCWGSGDSKLRMDCGEKRSKYPADGRTSSINQCFFLPGAVAILWYQMKLTNKVGGQASPSWRRRDSGADTQRISP